MPGESRRARPEVMTRNSTFVADGAKKSARKKDADPARLT